jgi:Flp pilus assembly protein TadG
MQTSIKPLRRPALGRQEGQSLVEMALILPLLMTLLIGGFKVAILFNNYIELTNDITKAVATLQPGANFIGTGPADVGANPCAAVSSTRVTNLYAPNLNPSKITYTVVINNPNTTPFTKSGGLSVGTGATKLGPFTGAYSCDFTVSGGTTPTPSLSDLSYATVMATYPCDLSIYGVDFFPGCILSAVSSVETD